MTDGPNAISRTFYPVPHQDQLSLCYPMGCGLCYIFVRTREYVGQRYYGDGAICERGKIDLHATVLSTHI